MNCKVSVVVPVFKVESFIGQCAASLFCQTWENVEYIFVDNNTPDASITVVKSLLESYPERKDDVVFLREERQGLGYARLSGALASTGKYVIHVDSDDWVESNFIEELVRWAEDTDADVVYCDYFKEYEGHSSKSVIVTQNGLQSNTAEAALCAVHRGIIKAFMCNKLLRRELYHFETLVVPIRNMHEDIVFQTQLLYNARKVEHLPIALYHYRRKRSGAITAGSVLRARRSSAEGLFHLYRSLPASGSPLDIIGDDLAARAAWYSMCSLNLSTLQSYPEVVVRLASMRPHCGRRVPVVGQWILKTICRLLLKTRL